MDNYFKTVFNQLEQFHILPNRANLSKVCKKSQGSTDGCKNVFQWVFTGVFYRLPIVTFLERSLEFENPFKLCFLGMLRTIRFHILEAVTYHPLWTKVGGTFISLKVVNVSKDKELSIMKGWRFLCRIFLDCSVVSDQSLQHYVLIVISWDQVSLWQWFL